MKIQLKIMTLTGLLIGLSVSSAMAAGFGVSGNQPAQAMPQQQAASQAVSAQSSEKQANHALGNTNVSQEAFAKMVRNMMPLTTDQIKTLRVMLEQSKKAVTTYPGTPPKPTSASVFVNLSPGATPPIVRLRAGFVTSLVFLDSTGEPWPIQAVDLGDPNSFNINWDKTGNTLLVQSKVAYKSGNVAVILKGKNTPIMLTLMPGQRAVDYRVDLRVPGLGPNASPELSRMPNAANPKLLSFLNGVPPRGAIAVKVEGGDAQAWSSGKHLYIRTRLTVLSPSWLATMRSPDGTNVYELTKSPVVLASDRGAIVQLTIQGL